MMRSERIRFDSVKENVPIPEVAVEFGLEGRGGRYFCPTCQPLGSASHRTPDLSVFDNNRRFKCFKCGISGDVIDFAGLLLSEGAGTSLNWLGERFDGIERTGKYPKPFQRSRTREPIPPDQAWQQRGLEVVGSAQTSLQSIKGIDSKRYLRGRGLSEATIQAARLGYVPTAVRDAPEDWGIESQSSIYIPANVILIPWIVNGRLWALKYRRMDVGTRNERYMSVKGSKLSGAMYQEDNLNGHRVIVFTEGEFDALLLQQYAGQLAGVATTGGCSGTIPLSAKFAVMAADRVLVAYDNDEPGENGAHSIIETSAKATRLRPISGKDISEMYLSGCSLRKFLLDAITNT